MRSRATSVWLAIVVALLTVPPTAHASAAVPDPKPLPELVPSARWDALGRALAEGRLSEAVYALERVRSLFDLERVRGRFGQEVARPDPRSATILMRDLLVRLDQLSPSDRTAARRLLARPTDGAGDPHGNGYSVAEEVPVCDPHVCVHYVATSADAPPMDDVGGVAGVPDHVETVSTILGEVWTAQIDQMGYRPPKSDATSANDGGDGRLDVYLADIGGDGLFGYCTSDDPNTEVGSGYKFWDVSAYCVLDDDYRTGQFGYDDPMDPLQVTAAHEHFHAVQAAYDWYEDAWLLESTATWIEDEIYDDVNDNLLYLRSSPLSNPLVPLDKSVAPRWYGTWIFWRFLAEYVGDGTSDPTIVRAVWRKADGSGPDRPDMYSTQALASSVAARSLDGTKWRFRWAFRDFGIWNAKPRKYYEEGTSYPRAKISGSVTLSGADSSELTSAKVHHLASRYVAVRRGSGLTKTARLRVRVDGPDRKTGSEASVVVIRKSGGSSARVVKLNSSGNGAVTVDFDRTVRRVVVIMTNASVRYTRCFQNLTSFACFGGRPVDQNRTYRFRVIVV